MVCGACFSGAVLNGADRDDFHSEMNIRIEKWRKLGQYETSVADGALVNEAYEFYLWDIEEDELQWFIITSISRCNDGAMVKMRFGVDEREITSKMCDSSRLGHFYSEIAKSEIFSLPVLSNKISQSRVIFLKTSMLLFMGIKIHDGRSTEVFRWVGESYPVDKVLETLLTERDGKSGNQ
tara:strand:- start:178 stop:717 length:540 start_codon:yes stop_codon:yes gene_type:complete